MQGKEVKPQTGCNNLQHRYKEKSSTIKSRVQGKEVKPQEGGGNFYLRDKVLYHQVQCAGKGVKPQEANDSSQQEDKNNDLSMEMVEDDLKMT